MATKRCKAEEVVGLLRRAEALGGQGLSMADVIQQLGISEVTGCRWHEGYGGMGGDQLRRKPSGHRHSSRPLSVEAGQGRENTCDSIDAT